MKSYLSIDDEDDNKPFFYGFVFEGENRLDPTSIQLSFPEEQIGTISLPENLLIDFDSTTFRNNKIFILSGQDIKGKGYADLSFRADYPSVQMIRIFGPMIPVKDRFAVNKVELTGFDLEVTQPLDYEVKKEWIITIGCARQSDREFTLAQNYNPLQLTQIILRLENLDDNPPVITGASNGILQASVFLTTAPSPDQPIYQIQFSDPDLDPTQLTEMPFIFEIAVETIKRRLLSDNDVITDDVTDSRVRRQTGSGSEYFQINEFGEVSLLKQIPSDILHLDLTILIKETENGPSSEFVLRFFPIKESDVIRIQTTEALPILTSQQLQIEQELAALIGDNVTAIVHDIGIDTGKIHDVYSCVDDNFMLVTVLNQSTFDMLVIFLEC